MSISWKKITLKELAAIVEQTLRTQGIETILVGGACVSIYTRNQYVSNDLDMITYTPMPAVKNALHSLGFEPRSSRHFEKKHCPFYIEFVPPPVAIGEQAITVFKELRTSLGKIKMLTPTDCVKDRLAAFFYWDDYQAVNQALWVARKHKIDWPDVRAWAILENQLEKYKRFVARIGSRQE